MLCTIHFFLFSSTHSSFFLSRALFMKSSLLHLEKITGTYDYFMLLSNGGELEYIELVMNPTDHVLGEVNDVSICLLDLESQLGE